MRTSLLNFRNLGPTAPSTPSYPSKSFAGAPTMPVTYSSALGAVSWGRFWYRFRRSLRSSRPRSFLSMSIRQCAPHPRVPSPLCISSQEMSSRWWHFCQWRWLSMENLSIIPLSTSLQRWVLSHVGNWEQTSLMILNAEYIKKVKQRKIRLQLPLGST